MKTKIELDIIEDSENSYTDNIKLELVLEDNKQYLNLTIESRVICVRLEDITKAIEIFNKI